MSESTEVELQHPLPESDQALEASDAPWAGATIPAGYRVTTGGVEKVASANDAQRLSGPIWASANTRDAQNNGWGLVLHWLDRDSLAHERAVPIARLHEQGTALIQELAADGLAIMPGKERALIQYLGSFHPERRILSVSRLGWVDDKDGHLVYVLPEGVIAADACPPIIYQPERFSPSSATIKAQGSLRSWQYHVARNCAGNPILTFSVCVALAAPLLKAAGMDGGGFHMYGGSSRGKTTALQVGASAWGCAVDPAEAADKTCIRRWNATRNGLEGLAAAHNDGLLALDELGSCDAVDFGRIIYDLSGGQGKAAMDVNRMLKEQRAWRNIILSTGEISALDKMQEGGKQAKAGQMLRMMDIPITTGIIVETQGLEAAAFANQLKRNCGLHYGTAGPAFLRAIIHEYPDFNAMRQNILACIDGWTKRFIPPGIPPEHQRAIRKLILLLIAGLKAQEYNVLPETLNIYDSIKAMRDAWLNDSTNLPDAVRGCQALCAFIMKHPDRFRPASGQADGRGAGREICGYISHDMQYYLFTNDGFKEACGGHSIDGVLNELILRGLLHVNEKRPKSRHQVTIDGTPQRPRFYAVKAKILSTEFYEQPSDMN